MVSAVLMEEPELLNSGIACAALQLAAKDIAVTMAKAELRVRRTDRRLAVPDLREIATSSFYITCPENPGLVLATKTAHERGDD